MTSGYYKAPQIRSATLTVTCTLFLKPGRSQGPAERLHRQDLTGLLETDLEGSINDSRVSTLLLRPPCLRVEPEIVKFKHLKLTRSLLGLGVRIPSSRQDGM